MNVKNTALALLFAASLVGCGDSGGSRDMGTGGDSGSGMDSGGHDAGMGVDSGGGTDMGGTDSGGGGDVAACQASVDAVKTACMASDPTNARLCQYDALRPLCATGRTAFVKTIFDCLAATTPCQTPGDPSGATACVVAAIHAAATANDHALGAAICTCEGAGSAEPNCDMMEPQYSIANLMLLNDSDVTAYTACLASMTCNMNGCYAASPLMAANMCP